MTHPYILLDVLDDDFPVLGNSPKRPELVRKVQTLAKSMGGIDQGDYFRAS
jgi:hypothetical protein